MKRRINGAVILGCLMMLLALPAAATNCDTFTDHSGHIPGSYDYAEFTEQGYPVTIVETFGEDIYVAPPEGRRSWDQVRKCVYTEDTTTTTSTTSPTTTTTAQETTTTLVTTTSIGNTTSSISETTTTAVATTSVPTTPSGSPELPFTGPVAVIGWTLLGLVLVGLGVSAVVWGDDDE